MYNSRYSDAEKGVRASKCQQMSCCLEADSLVDRKDKSGYASTAET